jgi:hypothetical protein
MAIFFFACLVIQELHVLEIYQRNNKESLWRVLYVAVDNYVHATAAIARSENIYSHSCRNFNSINNAQVIKQGKIMTLKI